MLSKMYHWLQKPNNYQKTIAYFLLIMGFLGLFSIGKILLSQLAYFKDLPSSSSQQIVVSRPKPTFYQQDSNSSSQTPDDPNDQVLGEKIGSIHLKVNIADEYFSHALTTQSAQVAPIFTLSAFGNFSGQVNFRVFEVDQDFLTEFLLHDENNDLINKEFNFDEQQLIAEFNDQLDFEESKQIDLPISGTGLWYIKVEGKNAEVELGEDQNISDEMLLLRSNLGGAVYEGDDKNIIWVQDLNTKRKVSDAQIRIVSYENSYYELSSHTTNQDGVVETPLTSQADVALIKRGGDVAVLPINLQHVNYGYAWRQFEPQQDEHKFFIFTDKPLYQPGDTVRYKAILRRDHDAQYSIPNGTVHVAATKDSSDEADAFITQDLSLSEHGTVFGEFQLPEDPALTHSYLLLTFAGQKSSQRIDVQEYRKPEYTLKLSTPQKEYMRTEDVLFELEGQYFSGEFLANETIDYEILVDDYYDFTYYNQGFQGNEFYFWGGYYNKDRLVANDKQLDQLGRGQIFVPLSLIPDFYQDKIVTVDVSYHDETGNRVRSVESVLVRAADFNVYREANTYQTTSVGESTTLDLELVPHQDGTINKRPVTASLVRVYWEEISQEGSKYPHYERHEEKINDFSGFTNQEGKVQFEFTPQKHGMYQWEVQAEDEQGHQVHKKFTNYVLKEGQPIHTPDNQGGKITIKADKEEYLPGETAQLNLYSEQPNVDLFITMERGFVHRYQVLSLQGTSTTLSMQLEDWDMPNIYVSVGSFGTETFLSSRENIVVRPDKQKLNVQLQTSKTFYEPGETVQLNVKTTDLKGNPVQADLAVWAVDKAMFELAADKTGDVFKHYWYERYNSTAFNHSLVGILGPSGAERGGCFTADTEILMADGSRKAIQDVQVGDRVLTFISETSSKLAATSVTSLHQAEVSGYLIINGDLKVTPNHKIYINDSFKRADTAKIGDELLNYRGEKVLIDSLEWVENHQTVYNLATANYHTYIANNLYVHNQKGFVRDLFVDTAYWNPKVRTNDNGEAYLEFVLPDNLTTWVIAGLGTTINTQAGQTVQEIVVGKKTQVRPVLPNLLRLGDKAYLSAIVHNFTDNDHEYKVSLEADTNQLKIKNEEQKITLAAGRRQQVEWLVEPLIQSAAVELTFSAQAEDDAELIDSLAQSIPIEPVGFREIKGDFQIGPGELNVDIDSQANLDKTSVSLSLTPSILGSADSGLRYFLSYPYGCAEQMSSRLLMILVAERNIDLFSESLRNHDINKMLELGIKQLKEGQNTDGGWPWWKGESKPLVSAYVVSVLKQLQLQHSNLSVDEILSRASYYFREVASSDSLEDRVAKYYALSFLEPDVAQSFSISMDDFQALDSDLKAWVIIADAQRNMIDGNKRQLLINSAQNQGENLAWPAGPDTRFGSTQASSALAAQALMQSGADHELIAKSIRYLLHNRSYFWANTYGTAQVMRAIEMFANYNQELEPNYSYRVLLGDEVLKTGQITSFRQLVNVDLPLQKLINGQNQLRIEQTGEGQVYSTLMVDQFVETTQAQPAANGIKIERDYVSEHGSNYNLAAGDEVTVRLTIFGLSSDESYGVIHDYLPAGMIPVNQALAGERVSKTDYDYDYYQGYQDVQGNGMVIYLPHVSSSSRTYKYKARVINPGTYYAPPATVSLMYAPEINAHTSVDKVELEQESKQITEINKRIQEAKEATGRISRLILAIFFIVLLGGVGYGWLWLKKNPGGFNKKFKQLTSRIFGKSQSVKKSKPVQNPQAQKQTQEQEFNNAAQPDQTALDSEEKDAA